MLQYLFNCLENAVVVVVIIVGKINFRRIAKIVFQT